MPDEVVFRTSIFGRPRLGRAFTECGRLARRRHRGDRRLERLLADLLAEHLPEVDYRPRHGASYLAWLDFRALGWGDDPALRALESRGSRSTRV